MNDASHRVSTAQKQLRDLQGSRQDKLKLYGAWQPELRQKIVEAMRQRKFHREPIGPIGTDLTFTLADLLGRCNRIMPEISQHYSTYSIVKLLCMECFN